MCAALGRVEAPDFRFELQAQLGRLLIRQPVRHLRKDGAPVEGAARPMGNFAPRGLSRARKGVPRAPRPGRGATPPRPQDRAARARRRRRDPFGASYELPVIWLVPGGPEVWPGIQNLRHWLTTRWIPERPLRCRRVWGVCHKARGYCDPSPALSGCCPGFYSRGESATTPRFSGGGEQQEGARNCGSGPCVESVFRGGYVHSMFYRIISTRAELGKMLAPCGTDSKPSRKPRSVKARRGYWRRSIARSHGRSPRSWPSSTGYRSREASHSPCFRGAWTQ